MNNPGSISESEARLSEPMRCQRTDKNRQKKHFFINIIVCFEKDIRISDSPFFAPVLNNGDPEPQC